MSFLSKVKQKYRDGLILNSIYARLKQKIFVVNLYYLTQEGLSDETDLDIQPKIEPIVIEHLKPSDMQSMSTKAERDYSEEKMLKMLSEGCKCMGIKYKGNIVSYMWYDLKNCKENPFSFSYELKENEAYIFTVRTLKAYRGRALAPYLNYQAYKHLVDIGRTKVYSIISFSNISSIKYHRKLNAKPLKLFMNVKFLNKYNWNILLKNYVPNN